MAGGGSEPSTAEFGLTEGDLGLKQPHKSPSFLKKFSKTSAPEERRQVASQVTSTRQDINKLLDKTGGELRSLELGSFPNLERINELKNQLEDLERRRKTIPQQKLESFYRQQAEKWIETPYSREDMEKYFSEEYLSSLSLDGYILLLRRFPSEMVTHVTRQGIRDHTGMMEHTEGAGQFSDGLTQILSSGRVKPAVDIWIDHQKKDIIAKFLELRNTRNKEQAYRYLNAILHKRGFGDIAAVHVALEEVADYYYGSERGNEIFFVFPAAHIASQFHFYRSLTEWSPGKNNDLYIWTQEQKGLNINSGIVFLPAEARVNPRNGSRYEINSQGNPVINQEVINSFKQLVVRREFADLAEKLAEYSSFNPEKNTFEPIPMSIKEEMLRTFLEKNNLEIDQRLIPLLLDSSIAGELRWETSDLKRRSQKAREQTHARIDETIRNALNKYGLLYKEAQDTISSQEYWENFFAENPQLKPSKIVYYKGDDPTKALFAFKKENGLSVRGQTHDLGFPERRDISYGDNQGQSADRFRILASEVIEEHFSSQPVAA